jgi:hypothetical protein
MKKPHVGVVKVLGRSWARENSVGRFPTGTSSRDPLGLSLALIGLAALPVLLIGCGGGSSSTPVARAQIREAKKAGEEAAHERDRVNSLQKQIHRLHHQVQHSASTLAGGHETGASVTPSAEQGDEVLRAFHVASGNVSCEVLLDGATCTVEPIAQTFAFTGGEPARIEPSVALPKDLGEVVPYGSTVAVGSVSCEIPPSNVPRGIVCSDAGSGHGFEASRVADRQSVY